MKVMIVYFAVLIRLSLAGNLFLVKIGLILSSVLDELVSVLISDTDFFMKSPGIFFRISVSKSGYAFCGFL